MKRAAEIIILLSLIFALVWAIGPAFLPIKNGDQRRMLTRHVLGSMTHDIVIYYEHTDPRETTWIRRVQTLHELWSQLQNKNVRSIPVIPSPLDPRYLTDMWGGAYKLQITARDRNTVIRITSNGPNGVFENGEGDDLYIQITFDGKRIEVTEKQLVEE